MGYTCIPNGWTAAVSVAFRGPVLACFRPHGLDRMNGMSVRGRGRGASRAGMTLIELLIAMVVVVIALLGSSSALYFSDATRQTTREKVLAQNAARRVIEQMRDANFTTLFALYSTGTNPGPTFTVEGLNAISGVPI